MPETDVKFTKKRGNAEDASTPPETTCTEVKILCQPSVELPANPRAEANRRSRVTSERVTLLVLCVFLMAAVAAVCVAYVTTKTRFQKLEKEYDKLEKKYDALKKKVKDTQCWKCEQGWEKHKGQCYHFSNETLSWNESRHQCKKMGGDLVKIDSEEEQRFLVERIRDKETNDKEFWIGLTDSKEEATWLWVDNSTLSTSLIFWHGLEPNNAGNPDGEDCVNLRVNEAEDLKTWFDQSCKADHKRICEKPAELIMLICLTSSEV